MSNSATRIVTAAESRRPARSGWPHDDRVFTRPELGLVAVAVARGPTYGGSHEPVAVEAGWQAIVAAWQDHPALAPDERLRRALAAANAVMLAVPSRPLTHTTASFTVAAFTDREVTLAQIGSCHAHHLRGTTFKLMSPDHTLATRLRGYGLAPLRRLADMPKNQRHVDAREQGLRVVRPERRLAHRQRLLEQRPRPRVVAERGVHGSEVGDRRGRSHSRSVSPRTSSMATNSCPSCSPTS